MINIHHTFDQDGTTIKELTYVSHLHSGVPVVVYALLALPNRASGVPGILHVHGGAQTASLDHVVQWARRGYAALSFDWTGPKEGREKFTDFGKASTDKYLVEPHPTYSQLHHATAIARSGLTLLAGLPQVNPELLGIYGISWGGFVCWRINGIDARIKAASAIYGCGGTLKWGNRGRPDVDLGDEAEHLWHFCYSPQSYAASQNGPMLFLNSTNDFFGWMDTAEELFTTLPNRHSLAFCPHFNHHLDAATSGNLHRWMETHLEGGAAWPVQPRIRIEPGNPSTIKIVPDLQEEIERVELFHSLNLVPPPCRFWNRIQLEKHPGLWVGNLPPVYTNVPQTVFATVYYRRGISISSIPMTIPSEEHHVSNETTCRVSIIDDFSRGTGDWFLNELSTEPFPEPLVLAEAKGPGGGPALTVVVTASEGDSFRWTLATRKIADPRWNAGGRRGLRLLCKALCTTEPFVVRFTRHSGLHHATAYTASVESVKAGWQEIEVVAGMFKGLKQDPLECFDKMDLLEIFSKSPVESPPILALAEWI